MFTAGKIRYKVLVNELSQFLIIEPLIVLAIPDPILPRLFLCLQLLQLVTYRPCLECLSHFLINTLHEMCGPHVALRGPLQCHLCLLLRLPHPLLFMLVHLHSDLLLRLPQELNLRLQLPD
jgi:hypothetical protein